MTASASTPLDYTLAQLARLDLLIRREVLRLPQIADSDQLTALDAALTALTAQIAELAEASRTRSRRTVKKSHNTRSFTWLCRHAFYVGEDGLRFFGRYFSTVDLATLMPILRSSPTIRGEPQLGFERHISWMSSRTSLVMASPPAFPSDSSVASSPGIAYSARRSRCEAGQTPEPVARLATGGTSRTRKADQTD